MTELIMQSLVRSCDNAIDEAANEEAVDKTIDHPAPLRRYLEVDNHSDPLFRDCIEAVELGQSVKVRIDENPVKYDKIKKRLERAEQNNSNCGAGQEKDGDISVPLFAWLSLKKLAASSQKDALHKSISHCN